VSRQHLGTGGPFGRGFLQVVMPADSTLPQHKGLCDVPHKFLGLGHKLGVGVSLSAGDQGSLRRSLS
jgi:hypothetical protein